MKPGLSRFDYFLNQLQPILATAARQKNPALWLYRNDARTPLFMLEGLSKLYAGLHNGKRFTKIKAHFKLLEDGIGAIDYYDMMAKDLVNNKKIPASVINYLQAQSREKIQSLNETLLENDWLPPGNKRLIKIKKKLEEADWLHEREEVNEIYDFYGETIYEIVSFVQSTQYQFNNIETEVHELRRKLRWLSIYPQALRGAIQLQKNPAAPKHLAKYLTKEIVESPFNKMPAGGELTWMLYLEENHFYALSWMIAELGNLKDQGLHIIAVKEALQQTSSITDENALVKTYQLLGNQQIDIPQILTRASNICKQYFKEQNLENLVIGTSPKKVI
ncbi:MAG: hypothetical protein JWP81_3788 [Ferruginibacter sp.]|nr:hypothetical protein [Ferruginibacter sp.]